MPPKKPTTTAKTPAKAPAKAPAKSTAAKPATSKTTTAKAPASKSTAAKAPVATQAEKPAPKPEPVVIKDVPFKQLDGMIVWDREGLVKASGKWALVMDENGLTGRFLRHRDVNMLSTPDNSEMDTERVRKALLGSVKYGKPFVIDMMDTEMYEFLVEKFNEISPNLLAQVLDKSILLNESYMQVVRESDGPDFENKYDYNIAGFSFLILSSCMAPNEALLQKMFPVKVIN